MEKSNFSREMFYHIFNQFFIVLLLNYCYRKLFSGALSLPSQLFLCGTEIDRRDNIFLLSSLAKSLFSKIYSPENIYYECIC